MRINPTNNITLLYDYENGNGIVQVPLAFDAMTNSDKLDALNDWAILLKKEYNRILGEEKRKKNK